MYTLEHISKTAKAFTQQLIAMETFEGARDLTLCVSWLTDVLERLDFEVSHQGSEGEAQLIIARRPACGEATGRVLLYNHYDVDEPHHDWDHEPFSLTIEHDRWIGLGIADNKGALAARLTALHHIEADTPEIVWVIQGQEESGSAMARAWFDALDPTIAWSAWFEENGWRTPEGPWRVLAMIGGHAPHPPKEHLTSRLLEVLDELDAPHQIETRYMNKSLVPGGCPFQDALPHGALYLSTGTNDPLTRIHAANESIASNAVAFHATQMIALLEAIAAGRLG